MPTDIDDHSTTLLTASVLALLSAYRARHNSDGEWGALQELRLTPDTALGNWDVIQNEAEVLFDTESFEVDRAVIDATSKPGFRRRLWRWADLHWDLVQDRRGGTYAAAIPEELLDAAVKCDVEAYARAISTLEVPPTLQPHLPCARELCIEDPAAARHAMRLWRVLSPASPLSALRADVVSDEAPLGRRLSATGTTAGPVQRDGSPDLDSQGKGALLERATEELLTLLFRTERSAADIEVRRQHAGTQYGADFAVLARTREGGVLCLLECKNYSRHVKLADIADKLLQAHTSFGGTPIDHWVLISPRAEPSNELFATIRLLNEQQTFGFDIQVWSPSTGVAQLLALAPAFYEQIFGIPPIRAVDHEAVLERFRRRLAPVPRLPRGLASYLAHRTAIAVGQEERLWLDPATTLLPRTGVARNGSPLAGDLLSYVADELTATRGRTVLLLAEFGEGKSCFTVQLCDELRHRFVRDADADAFPIRLRLSEFRHHGSAVTFLNHQLEALGSSLAELHRLRETGRPVMVLDGLDEMSAGQDDASLHNDLRKLEDLLALLEDVSVLVTSRPQLFRTVREQELFEDRLRRPLVVYLSRLRRREVVTHLRQYAARRGLGAKLESLKALYDPIGMAEKALFLHMLKEVLPDLPDDEFDLKLLYDTYVDTALERKLDLLDDGQGRSTRRELRERLRIVLEDLAVSIHQSTQGWVDLEQHLAGRGGASTLLWSLVVDDPTADSDAAARLGTRTLLRRLDEHPDEWRVDLAHRSLREFLVASALGRASTSPDPANDLPVLLADLPMSAVAVDFYRLLVPTATTVPLLETIVESAVRSTPATGIGGWGLSLLHAVGGRMQDRVWRDLDLDHALLRHADLSGCDLRGSSLRFADLSSADLNRADLRGCDLDGANLGGQSLTAIAGDPAAGRTYAITAGHMLVRLNPRLAAAERIGPVAINERPTSMFFVDEDLVALCVSTELVMCQIRGTTLEEVVRFKVRDDTVRFGLLTSARLWLSRRLPSSESLVAESAVTNFAVVDLEGARATFRLQAADGSQNVAAGTGEITGLLVHGSLWVLDADRRVWRVPEPTRLETLLVELREGRHVVLASDSGGMLHRFDYDPASHKPSAHTSSAPIGEAIDLLASDSTWVTTAGADGTVAFAEWDRDEIHFSSKAHFTMIMASNAAVADVVPRAQRDLLLSGGAVLIPATADS